MKLQLVFGTVEFGSDRALRNSFDMVSGEQDRTKVLWAARVLILFRIRCRTKAETEEYAFIPYMECTDSLDEVGSFLGLISLRWSV